MADAPTPEQRRRVASLSAAESAMAEPPLVVQVKLLVAEVDAMAAEDRSDLVAAFRLRCVELSQDWSRLFQGCKSDMNRARYSIYRRSRAQLEALYTELDALVNP